MQAFLEIRTKLFKEKFTTRPQIIRSRNRRDYTVEDPRMAEQYLKREDRGGKELFGTVIYCNLEGP